MSRLLPWGLAVALGLVLLQVRGCYERRDGARAEQVRGLEQAIARRDSAIGSLARRSAKVDTQYIAKRRLVAVSDGRYEALRDSLRQSTPADTGAATIVTRLAGACDTALANLHGLASVCEQQVAQRDTTIGLQRVQITGLDSLLDLERSRRPGWFRRTFGCAAGASATTRGAGLGATCGLRF